MCCLAVLYHLACFLAIHTPVFFCRFLSRRVAEIRYLALPRMRRTVRQNMSKVLEFRRRTTGQPWDRRLLERTVLGVYYNFARYMVDFFTFPRWSAKEVVRRVKVEGLNHLDEALRQGRGVVALTAHLGNWELAGVVTSFLGYPVNAIALTYRHPSITRIFVERRKKGNVNVALTGRGPRQILSALHRGEIVAVLGDRLFTEKGVAERFLGREVLLPRGPATLAVKTGAAMLPGFLFMDGEGFRLVFSEKFRVPEGADEETQILSLMRQGAKAMESAILSCPDQWLNFSPLREA